MAENTPAAPAAPVADPAAPAADPALGAPAVDPAAPPAADPANPANPAPAADPAAPAATDPATDPAADPATDAEADPAPVEYDLQVPEGQTLDPEVSAKFTEWAKAKNLTNEEAQELLDMSLEVQEKQAAAYRATQAEWVEQSKSDKEFGGSKFAENLAVANSALDAVGTPELKQLLKSTGFGNHPEVIRTFVKVGKALGEDKLVIRSTNTPAPGKPDKVQLYPKSNMKV